MRSPSGAGRAAALVVALSAGVAAPPAMAAGTKLFAAVVEPRCVEAGGTGIAFSITLTNLSKNQQLGSANVRLPDGFAVTGGVALVGASSSATASVPGSGALIELRDLRILPARSVVASWVGAAGPVGSDGRFGVAAKPSNDFTGSTAFTLDASASQLVSSVDCRLAFVVQPSHALVGETITGDPFAPSSSRQVSVAALDGSGAPISSFADAVTLSIDPSHDPGGTTLQGTTARAASAGVAAFDDVHIDVHGFGYALRADADGFLPATSTTFAVADAGTVCGPRAPASTCSAQTVVADELNGAVGAVASTVTSTGGPAGGVVIVGANTHEVDCAGYVEHTDVTITFDVTTGEAKTVTVVIDKALVQADPNNGAAHYQVCYSSPTVLAEDAFGNPVAFFARDGSPVYPEGNPAGLVPTSGLLPDCGATLPGMPCRVSSNKDRAGNEVLVYRTPAGDPKGRV